MPISPTGDLDEKRARRRYGSDRTPSDVNLIGVNGGKVECQIFGVPKPKVVWYKDFHPLKETFRVQAYHYPPDVYTLFIEDYITRVSCQLPMVK